MTGSASAVVLALCQYKDDLLYTPDADSVSRRVPMIDKAISEAVEQYDKLTALKRIIGAHAQITSPIVKAAWHEMYDYLLGGGDSVHDAKAAGDAVQAKTLDNSKRELFRIFVQAETYSEMHRIATNELGYESLLEALEAAPRVEARDKQHNSDGYDNTNPEHVAAMLSNHLDWLREYVPAIAEDVKIARDMIEALVAAPSAKVPASAIGVSFSAETDVGSALADHGETFAVFSEQSK